MSDNACESLHRTPIRSPLSISAKRSANIEIFSNYGEWILLRF